MSYGQKVKQDIKRMDSILSKIETLSKDIGTFNDGVNLREDIQNNVKDLMETSKDVKTNISIMRQNDDPDLDSVQKSFDEVSNRMKSNLPRVINGLKASTPSTQPNASHEVYNQPLIVDQSLVDADSDQLAILENEVNQILSNMKEVNALFEKTMSELQNQKHLIIGIDNMTAKGAEDMSMGTLELEKAESHQKGSRKCLCWIVLILIVIVGCVVVFVAVFVSKKKKSDDSPAPGPGPTPIPPPTQAPPTQEPPTDEAQGFFRRKHRSF